MPLHSPLLRYARDFSVAENLEISAIDIRATIALGCTSLPA